MRLQTITNRALVPLPAARIAAGSVAPATASNSSNKRQRIDSATEPDKARAGETSEVYAAGSVAPTTASNSSQDALKAAELHGLQLDMQNKRQRVDSATEPDRARAGETAEV
jgi:hypothetical protein